MLGRRVRGELPKTALAIVGLFGERISARGASVDITQHTAEVVVTGQGGRSGVCVAQGARQQIQSERNGEEKKGLRACKVFRD